MTRLSAGKSLYHVPRYRYAILAQFITFRATACSIV